MTCNDKHPLTVQLAGRDIVLMGWTDYKGKTREQAVNGIDVFFGLDSGWRKYEVQQLAYQNSLVQALYNKFCGMDEVDNILEVPIPDRGIDLYVYELIRQTFEEGKSIGFGCMAGHGRTGWVYAKLIKEFEGCSGDEAVRRVRERYCPKCVESKTQTKDLGCVVEKGSDALTKPLVKVVSPGFSNSGRWGEVTPNPITFPSTPVKVHNHADSYFKDGQKDWSWFSEPIVNPTKEGVGDTDTGLFGADYLFAKGREDKSFSLTPVNVYCTKCLKDLLPSEYDKGDCPFCGSVNLYFDYTKVEEEVKSDTSDEKLAKLTKAYSKYMDNETLSAEEEALIQQDFNK